MGGLILDTHLWSFTPGSEILMTVAMETWTLLDDIIRTHKHTINQFTEMTEMNSRKLETDDEIDTCVIIFSLLTHNYWVIIGQVSYQY